MDKEVTTYFESDWNDEWYQSYYMCNACKCYFMTYLDNETPHNYCPNCGRALVERSADNG